MTNVTIDTDRLGAYERDTLGALIAAGTGKRLMVGMSEAKRHINVPASTLRMWCKNGFIVCSKRGRVWHLSIDDAVGYAKSGEARRSQSQRRRREREGAERGE